MAENFDISKIDSLSSMSIVQVKAFFIDHADKIEENIEFYKELVCKDGRNGVKILFKKFEKSIIDKKNEERRVKKLYNFQNTIAAKPGKATIVGLDEVGRGPLAGPLTVGAVVLNDEPIILGLNDSKKIPEDKRIQIACQIKKQALIYETFSVPPTYIDKLGMTECLRRAFSSVVKKIEDAGYVIDVILLDGNPLSFDPREVNVIKGDSKCASIAAASIIAKVERDQYMINISSKYPNYCFESNKGYGTASHIEAIKNYGLSPIHRKSFCNSFMQMSLF